MVTNEVGTTRDFGELKVFGNIHCTTYEVLNLDLLMNANGCVSVLSSVEVTFGFEGSILPQFLDAWSVPHPTGMHCSIPEVRLCII